MRRREGSHGEFTKKAGGTGTGKPERTGEKAKGGSGAEMCGK